MSDIEFVRAKRLAKAVAVKRKAEQKLVYASHFPTLFEDDGNTKALTETAKDYWSACDEITRIDNERKP